MYYTIYLDVQNQWRWNLRSANHEIIASGESYYNENDCIYAIELVKSSANAPILN